MRRYRGEELPSGCRIAVIANDALGNYVVTTPLLQKLRERHRPDSLDYYSGIRTEELWRQDPNVTWGFPLFGSRPDEALRQARGPYDLIVNIESSPWAKSFASLVASEDTLISGPCLSPDGRGDLPFPNDCFGRLAADPNWISSDLQDRHACVESGFIGEILCRVAYLQGAIPSYSVPMELPPASIPDVLISASASLPEKLWDARKWTESIKWLRSRGLTVGVVGAKPEEQRRYWYGDSMEQEILAHGLAIDFRGKMTLPQVVGALSKARACLTLDNGILHLAAAVKTPTVGLFRQGFDRLWAPPVSGLISHVDLSGGPVSNIGTDVVVESLTRILCGKAD